ncbi:MAG: hypothetical protein HQ574_01170 [Chloroflexi bacterium]|nr:hypothetical protein [Chloroflexota bacterium]
MKRILLAVAVLTIAIVTLGVTSPALGAEFLMGGPRSGDPEEWGLRQKDNLGELGMGTGIPLNQNLSLNQEIAMDGLLDEIIHENLAAALRISSDELSTRVADGESIFDIAISLGEDAASFSLMMAEVRINALAQGVDLDLLTQDQADWMASRSFGNPVFESAEDCKSN